MVGTLVNKYTETLLVIFRTLVAHTVLLPSLMVAACGIYLITLRFEEVKEFSDGTDLTYIIKGRGIKRCIYIVIENLRR